jgi:thymidylate synthase
MLAFTITDTWRSESMPEIKSDSISEAWLRAVSIAAESPQHEISPLVVVIGPIQSGHPIEDRRVREALDQELGRSGLTVETISNTIFPHSLWNPKKSRGELFRRYMNILPKIRSHTQNRRGVYFERFISYPGNRGQPGRNQLDHIIATYQRGNHRRSALQMSVFVPESDLNNSRQLGFPCLQQVAFEPNASRGTLAVTGFYAMQYLFRRAYGNYLGLTRLGQFVAHELRLTLETVICVAAVAHLEGHSKIAHRIFEKQTPLPRVGL